MCIGREIKAFWNFWALEQNSVICVWDLHITSSDILQTQHGPNVIKTDCKAVLVKYSTWCEWNNMFFPPHKNIVTHLPIHEELLYVNFWLWIGKYIFLIKIAIIFYLSIMISHVHTPGNCTNQINLPWYFLEIYSPNFTLLNSQCYQQISWKFCSSITNKTIHSKTSCHILETCTLIDLKTQSTENPKTKLKYQAMHKYENAKMSR